MFNPLVYYELGCIRLIYDIVAYFPFNNSQDYVSKQYGVENNINYTNGKVGNAATFNGVNSNILFLHQPQFNFCDNNSDKPFSIGMYVKFEKTGDQWLISKRRPLATGHAYQFIYAAGKLSFTKFSLGLQANYIEISMPFTPTLNQWYFIFYTDNGGTGGKIYINGVTSSTASITNSYVRMSPINLANISFGYLSLNNTRYFKGQIDCLAFFNKELSAAEITQIQAKIDSGSEIII